MSHAFACYIFVALLLKNSAAFNSVSQLPYIPYKHNHLIRRKHRYSKKTVLHRNILISHSAVSRNMAH